MLFSLNMRFSESSKIIKLFNNSASWYQKQASQHFEKLATLAHTASQSSSIASLITTRYVAARIWKCFHHTRDALFISTHVWNNKHSPRPLRHGPLKGLKGARRNRDRPTSVVVKTTKFQQRRLGHLCLRTVGVPTTRVAENVRQISNFVDFERMRSL